MIELLIFWKMSLNLLGKQYQDILLPDHEHGAAPVLERLWGTPRWDSSRYLDYPFSLLVSPPLGSCPGRDCSSSCSILSTWAADVPR